jgi:hypothetical protein
MHVFAYGSLMHPDSLARTLPDLELDHCVPARLVEHVRTFDVAFPNDGSQADKAYLGSRGARPPVVLFANVRPSTGAIGVNGILIPVGARHLELLVGRERRYDLVDITGLVQANGRRPRPVATFVGARRFTRARRVRQGVVSREYLATIQAGVARWDRTLPGFTEDFRSSTILPTPRRVVDLVRVDLAG